MPIKIRVRRGKSKLGRNPIDLKGKRFTNAWKGKSMAKLRGSNSFFTYGKSVRGKKLRYIESYYGLSSSRFKK